MLFRINQLFMEGVCEKRRPIGRQFRRAIPDRRLFAYQEQEGGNMRRSENRSGIIPTRYYVACSIWTPYPDYKRKTWGFMERIALFVSIFDRNFDRDMRLPGKKLHVA